MAPLEDHGRPNAPFRRGFSPPPTQARQLVARVTAARILERLKRAYMITPKPPQPLATADQHQKMGSDR